MRMEFTANSPGTLGTVAVFVGDEQVGGADFDNTVPRRFNSPGIDNGNVLATISDEPRRGAGVAEDREPRNHAVVTSGDSPRRASSRGARLSILLNRGAGRFAQATGSPISLAKRPFSVAIADLNRDRHPDLVAATVDSVTVLLGNGRAFPRAGRSSFRAGPGAYNVTVGDVNADERPDVLASSFESNGVTVLLGR